jgi:Rrf2 family transcriptional regulator, nitric oxide-sensitive transcriptional repressor
MHCASDNEFSFGSSAQAHIVQLTQFTDYSLRSLMFLGAHPGRLCKIAQIAAAYGISVNHLMKVVNRLASCGYVETIRGKGGGLRLARAPRLINLGEVVRDMEERFDIVECFNEQHQDCPLLPACVLRSVLGDARRNFMATLDRYTLEDVIGGNPAGVFAPRKGTRIPIRRAG